MAASYYPVDEDDEPGKVRFTTAVKAELHADLDLVADLWNEFDEHLEKNRRVKWKGTTSVLERFVAIGLDGFWQQVGGRPPTKEGREEFIRAAIERIRKQGSKR